MVHKKSRLKIGGLPYPTPTSKLITSIMQSNRSSDTRPELRIRSLVHAQGYRFRKSYRVYLRTGYAQVDIAFTRIKLAVFIDGCFWHCCQEHASIPKSNVGYWKPKLQRNVERDHVVNIRLDEAGWTVLRLWEHVPAIEAVDRIIDAINRLVHEASQTCPKGR